MNIPLAQKLLREESLDGWLFTDFRNRDPLTAKLLGVEKLGFASRRWFYLLPRRGAPLKVVSAVEPHILDELPGRAFVYRTWRDLREIVTRVLRRHGARIAAQYSPRAEVPYLSTLDAGTAHLFSSLGAQLSSSGNLLHYLLSALTTRQYRAHVRAGKKVDQIRRAAFTRIDRRIRTGAIITEFDVQRFILRAFERESLVCDHPPMVGVNGHPADPHFEVSASRPSRIRKNDTVLIDLWAKENHPDGIYYDSTWVGFVGDSPPTEYLRIFETVVRARDGAVAYLSARLASGAGCRGCDVDRAARKIIARAGYGAYFVHRTGHSITQQTHGEGVNIDDFETRDTRALLPGALVSVEPGIYLPGRMAVRSEINVFIRDHNHAEVTGEVQRELVKIGV